MAIGGQDSSRLALLTAVNEPPSADTRQIGEPAVARRMTPSIPNCRRAACYSALSRSGLAPVSGHTSGASV